ncbi:MAG: NTP transferase domain-containing protein [Gammaproteobacteria bacterium]
MTKDSGSRPPVLDVAVLCAGQSRRLGHPKQHVELDGQTLLQRSLILAEDALESAGSPHRPILVSGAFLQQDCRVLNARFSQGAINHRLNYNWRAGMSASLACARDAALGDGLLVFLVDQYRLTHDDLEKLYRQWRKAPEKPVAASYAETEGPPVIWPRHLLKPDTTATGRHNFEQQDTPTINKSFLRSHHPVLIDIKHAAIDLDDEEDLKVAKRFFKR